MTYELWDARSGNRLGAFAAVDDALDVVRDMARLDGMAVVGDL